MNIEPLVTHKTMDETVEKLNISNKIKPGFFSSSFWSPHQAPFGLGNYDVNLLMFIVEEKGSLLYISLNLLQLNNSNLGL